MKLIILGVVVILAFISVQVVNLWDKTARLTTELRVVSNEIATYNSELTKIAGYKDARPALLTNLYVEILNKVKAVAAYYEAIGEVRIPGAEDLVNIEQSFKDSVFHGVKYVDVLCKIDFKGKNDGSIFDYFYEIQKNNPVEIVGVKIEKTAVNIQMRLYGV